MNEVEISKLVEDYVNRVLENKGAVVPIHDVIPQNTDKMLTKQIFRRTVYTLQQRGIQFGYSWFTLTIETDS